MTDKKPTLIFLMGPTASGKSALAFALAECLPVEIVSVDATQVYHGLDIGSAKPSVEEQTRVIHHLIDIRDPSEVYSAAEFRRDALAAIADIVSRDKIPLLVGGTMLYFNTLIKGLADLPQADKNIRAAIDKEAQAVGWPAMHQQLAQVDPVTSARLHPNHSQRIARALEIYRITGQPMSVLHAKQQTECGGKLEDDYELSQFALTLSRERLHQRIDQRFNQMLDQGLEAEVKALKNRGDLNLSLPAIRSVGYRQMWSYLHGDYSFADMVEKAKAATRQLAKRQTTWLRSWENLQHIDTQDSTGNLLKIKQIRDQTLNSFKTGTI